MVLTTATVHLLHVQTQWDLLAVHVAVLTSEMEKLALIFHTVNNHQQLGRCPFTRPLFTLVRSMLL